MSFWRKIASRAVGRVDGADCPDCPPGLPGEDPAFSTAVTALGAKLARADGRADRLEYNAFAEVFTPDEGSERNVERLYDLARQTTLGYESYAKRLAKRYRNCPQLLEDVVDGLFHIAKSDGATTDGELAYLQRVAELFGLSALQFRRVKATHLGLAPEDPYAVLNVEPDASDEAVRAAWRRSIAEAHPDRVVARGLPPEYVEVAQAKAAALNAAFDAVMRERRGEPLPA
ncbi:MAG TPA: DnaJ family molecular chaperone [Caulobacteraceae bacterium]|jgi:DnaJ like chaperone protein